jgi:DNA-directed RNA polymerase specialized sigma24 family protein
MTLTDKPRDESHPAEQALALLTSGRVSRQDREKAAYILVKRMGGGLKRHVMYKVGLNEDQAEEAVTDAVMRFLETPPRPGSAGGWLYATVFTKGVDILRKAMAEKRGGGVEHVSVDVPPDSEFGPGHGSPQLVAADDTEKTVRLRQLIGVIVDEFKERGPDYVAVLHLVMQGCPEQDIAEELNISPALAKARVYQLRQIARKVFKD